MLPGPDYILACPRCGALHRRRSLVSGNTFGSEVWTDGWRFSPMLPETPLVTRCQGCGRLFWVARAQSHEAREALSWQLQPVAVVTLEQVGKRRVEVMHLVRRELGANLQQVKARVERLPLRVGEYFDREEARALVARFEELGARATLAEAQARRQVAAPASEREAPLIQPPDEAGWLEALAEGLAHGPEEERELRLRAWWEGNEPHRRGVPWKPFSQRSQAAGDNLRALRALCSPAVPAQRLLRAEALRELECFEEALAALEAEFPEGLRWVAEGLRALTEQRIAEVRRLEPEARTGARSPSGRG